MYMYPRSFHDENRSFVDFLANLNSYPNVCQTYRMYTYRKCACKDFLSFLERFLGANSVVRSRVCEITRRSLKYNYALIYTYCPARFFLFHSIGQSEPASLITIESAWLSCAKCRKEVYPTRDVIARTRGSATARSRALVRVRRNRTALCRESEYNHTEYRRYSDVTFDILL